MVQNEKIENILLKLQQRGMEFLDDNLRITNSINLFQKEKMKRLFEEEVIGNFSVEIERMISDLIDWILTRNKKQFNNIIYYMQQNMHDTSNQMIGKVNTNFLRER